MFVDYLISDLHFDDDTVLRGFRRPFATVDDMNEFLRRQWNATVEESARVLVVGDVVLDRDRSPKEVENRIIWRFDELNGDITLIKGDHDTIKSIEDSQLPACKEQRFSHREYDFYCRHEPTKVPSDFDGWVIHGHKHTNYPDRYPLIEPVSKTINVSAELLHYTPISIEELVRLVETGERRLAR